MVMQSAGSTIQSIALKYVMASEPYRHTWYLKQVMTGLPCINIYFIKHLEHILNILKLTLIFLDILTKIIFCSITFQSQFIVI